MSKSERDQAAEKIAGSMSFNLNGQVIPLEQMVAIKLREAFTICAQTGFDRAVYLAAELMEKQSKNFKTKELAKASIVNIKKLCEGENTSVVPPKKKTK